MDSATEKSKENAKVLKKLRKVINAILGIDGNRIIKEVEDISWGLRLQSLTMASSWYKGGGICRRMGGRLSLFMCFV